MGLDTGKQNVGNLHASTADNGGWIGLVVGDAVKEGQGFRCGRIWACISGF